MKVWEGTLTPKRLTALAFQVCSIVLFFFCFQYKQKRNLKAMQTSKFKDINFFIFIVAVLVVMISEQLLILL